MGSPRDYFDTRDADEAAFDAFVARKEPTRANIDDLIVRLEATDGWSGDAFAVDPEPVADAIEMLRAIPAALARERTRGWNAAMEAAATTIDHNSQIPEARGHILAIARRVRALKREEQSEG